MLICASTISCLIFSFVISGIYTLVSSHNYPGGHAITILTNELIPHRHTTEKLNGVKLYLDVASAMTGVSEFEQHELMNHISISHYKTDKENDCASDCIIIDYNKTGCLCQIVKGGYEERNTIQIDIEDKNCGYYTFTHILSERSYIDGFTILAVAKGNPILHIRNYSIFTKDT